MVIDINKIIEETINNIIKKYINKEETISPYRDKEEDIISLEDEIFEELNKLDIPFDVITTDAFKSCGYECSTVVVSWYNANENKVNSTSILTEIC